MCRRSLFAGLSSLALCAACMPAFAGLCLITCHKHGLLHSATLTSSVII